MKRLLCLLVCLLVLLSLCACSQPAMSEEDILEAAQKIIDEQNALESDNEDLDVPEESEKVNEEEDDFAIGEADDVSNSGTDLEKNIECEVYALANGEALMVLSNKNKTSLPYTELTVTFYDEGGQMLKKFQEYFYAVLPESKVMTVTYGLAEADTFDSFKFKVDIDSEYYEDYEDLSQYVTIEANESANGGIIAEFTNNSDKEIKDLKVVVIYVNNDVIVGADLQYAYDLAPNDYDVLEFYPPYDKNYENLEYDNFTVIANQAIAY